MKNIKDLISQHVFEYNILAETTEVVTYPADSIIFNPLRFDLMVKVLYVENYLRGTLNKWICRLYEEHILYFNNFREDNFPNKNNGKDFRESFEKLIELFSKKNIPKSLITIPIDKTFCPIDGAHRLAIASVKKMSVNSVLLDKKFPLTWYAFDYLFFRSKGMPTEMMDYVALEYAKRFSKSYTICLFPACKDRYDEIDSLIRDRVSVYYDKDFYLNVTGQLNFMLTLYRKEDWLGNFDNCFKGARWKAGQCFSKEGFVRVYLVVSESLEEIISLKKDIRTLCGIGNHSVHSTDTYDTTCELSSIAFNQNTVDFINTAQVTRFPNFLHQISLYRQYIQLSNISPDNFCIDGSAILAVCNLRDCYDLDFLFNGNERSLTSLPQRVDCHNRYMVECGFDRLLNLTISDIITSPELYFYYDGYKVMIPELIDVIKKHRGEPKDLRDVELLAIYIANKNENKNPERSIIDPDWYSNLDTLLRRKIIDFNLKNISLNARLFIPHAYQNIITEWAESYNIPFSISDFFYTFEAFQGLKPADEKYFWIFWGELLQRVIVNDKTALLFTARICYCLAATNFLLMPTNHTFLLNELTQKIERLK